MNEPTLPDLIALGEGFTTEFKLSMPSNLGRELCAFANATGGVVLIGVDDAGTVVGVKDHNRLKSQVQSVARSADPPVAVEVESMGTVLCVTVSEQHGKPYSFGGRFYMREGATCQQMSREEIRDFFFEEGLIRIDETPCKAFDPSVEITPARWSEFAECAGIDPELDPMTVLENLHLVKDSAMTHAGAWLLADDITRFTMQAGVTCAVFRGRSKTHILDRKEFKGNLYSIFHEVMGYFQAKLNSALIPNAEGRDERLELPESALREAIVNAIAHRDYRSTANVQVYIFQDRVEIVTPGGLPAGMREKDLGSKSVPRNPLLFSMLYRMKLVEQIGSGIRRIRDACSEHGVGEPAIEVSPDWLTVTFSRSIEAASPHVTSHMTPHVVPHVTPHVVRLIGALQGEMSRAALMKTLELLDRRNFVENYLQPALDAGLVEMTLPNRPRSRSQRYRLTAQGSQIQDSQRGDVWMSNNKGWPRNSYTGLGGGLYTGPGGGLYTGPGGGAYTGPGGGLYDGPGGGLYDGPGGGLYAGPGGGLYDGPGGGLYDGPGGGLYDGPGGGLYDGPGGGLYTGPSPYYSNMPPREVYLEYLLTHGYHAEYLSLKDAWGL